MKFLIIKLSSMGDIVHSLPLVYTIKKHFSNAQVDWLVGDKGFELLSLINEVDNVYLLELQNIFSIQKKHYDFVIDVQGLFKSAFFSRISFGKKIIGFKNPKEKLARIFYDEKIDVGELFKTNNHIVDLNLKLIARVAKTLDKEVKFLMPKINAPDDKSILSTTNQNPSLIVFPGTRWESKLWPMEYWFDLLKSVSYDFNIYLCGSSSDLQYVQPLIDKLNSNSVPYNNLIGKTSIKNLIYLVQHANLVVSCDSFGLHLASAIKNDYGFPEVIGIYGPTSPFRSGPYNAIQNCLYLSKLECIACRRRQCPLGHHKCMNDISPLDVKNMIYSKSVKKPAVHKIC